MTLALLEAPGKAGRPTKARKMGAGRTTVVRPGVGTDVMPAYGLPSTRQGDRR